MASLDSIVNNSLVQEPSITSIRDSDEQTAANGGDRIQLERSQNPWVNDPTSKVLERIFEWSIALGRDHPPYDPFRDPKKGTYNFLSVCHYWTNVACGNQKLWTFWGPDLKEWARNGLPDRARDLLVDLTFSQRRGDPEELSAELEKALKVRAGGDKIRQIHLESVNNAKLLRSILSALTPDGKGIPRKSMESIIFRTSGEVPEEISNFFAQSSLPGLRCLEMSGSLRIPMWDHMPSQITGLTCLSLIFAQASLIKTTHFPTTRQLTTLLAANPNLQELELWGALPEKIEDFRDAKIPLDHLTTIKLFGGSYSTVELLSILRFPATLDVVHLAMVDPKLDSMDQILGPHIEDLFRDAKFSESLQVFALDSDMRQVRVHVIPYNSLEVEGPEKIFDIHLSGPRDPLELKQLAIDLMKLVPRERVEALEMCHTPEVPDEPFIGMPKLKALELNHVVLSKAQFLQADPDGAHSGMNLFPSLETLGLTWVVLKDRTWQRLRDYVENQSSGGVFKTLDVIQSCADELDRNEWREMTEYFERLGVDAYFHSDND